MWLNIKGSLLQIQISYFFSPEFITTGVCVCVLELVELVERALTSLCCRKWWRWFSKWHFHSWVRAEPQSQHDVRAVQHAAGELDFEWDVKLNILFVLKDPVAISHLLMLTPWPCVNSGCQLFNYFLVHLILKCLISDRNLLFLFAFIEKKGFGIKETGGREVVMPICCL